MFPTFQPVETDLRANQALAITTVKTERVHPYRRCLLAINESLTFGQFRLIPLA
jgi:hypothetical protein